jgi:FtsH-binding integral membrane protein
MSYGFGDSVWKREGAVGEGQLSRYAYLQAVTFATVYGLVISSMVAYSTMSWKMGVLGLIVVGLVVPIIGIVIALSSDSWPISLFGYTLVTVGLGAIIGPTVGMLSSVIVMKAFMATCGVTVVMSLIGIFYPRSLEHWGGYLFAGLLALVFVRIAQGLLMSFGVGQSLWYVSVIEYAATALFSLYIIYDWNRALRLPHTLDNAVDCALAIYLDIVNLFVTLLRIYASGSDD